MHTFDSIGEIYASTAGSRTVGSRNGSRWDARWGEGMGCSQREQHHLKHELPVVLYIICGCHAWEPEQSRPRAEQSCIERVVINKWLLAVLALCDSGKWVKGAFRRDACRPFSWPVMWLPTADGDSIELYSYVNRHNQLFNLACNLRGHCAVTFSFGRAVRLARHNSSAAPTGLHMWFMPGPVSWPYHIAYSYKSSRQCIFAYDWHPFRFSCIVFSGPRMRSIGRCLSTYSHRPVCTIYRCTARPPVAPGPLSLSLLPIGISCAFIVRCAFPAADFGFICSLLAAVYVAFKWVIEQMDVRYACLPTYEYNYVLELELIRCEPNRSFASQSPAPASFACQSRGLSGCLHCAS